MPYDCFSIAALKTFSYHTGSGCGDERFESYTEGYRVLQHISVTVFIIEYDTAKHSEQGTTATLPKPHFVISQISENSIHKLNDSEVPK